MFQHVENVVLLYYCSDAEFRSEFNSFRFVHRYPDRRNLIWDPENKKWYVAR